MTAHKVFPLLFIETGTKDERLQPWYIAAILRPKNVVILFDISYSMKEENKIIFARTAITPVLKGLLPTDFVNVSVLRHFVIKEVNYLFKCLISNCYLYHLFILSSSRKSLKASDCFAQNKLVQTSSIFRGEQSFLFDRRFIY